MNLGFCYMRAYKIFKLKLESNHTHTHTQHGKINKFGWTGIKQSKKKKDLPTKMNARKKQKKNVSKGNISRSPIFFSSFPNPCA